jgi:hypothetical protein
MDTVDHEEQFVSAVTNAIRNGAIDRKGGNAFTFLSEGCKIEVAIVPKIPKTVLEYLRVDGINAPPLSQTGVEAVAAAVDEALANDRKTEQLSKNIDTFAALTGKLTNTQGKN